MKTDYKHEIKKLLSRFYTPVIKTETIDDKVLMKSLENIHSEVSSVLPKKWVYEEDVYEALVDLGFKAFLNEKDNKSEPLYFLKKKE